MSLDDWLNNSWLIPHHATKQEITDLLSVIDRDIRAASVIGLDTDWRLGIAYNACLQCAVTALVASGYRASRIQHHYRAIQSLAFTMALEASMISSLDVYRRMRNFADYERAGTIPESAADEALHLAQTLRNLLLEWLSAQHPELL